MKHIYFRILGLILVVLLTISCGQKSLEGIDFTKGNYEMHFLVPYVDDVFVRNNAFLNKYKSFYIDDKETLEKVWNQVIKEKTNFYASTPTVYIFRLEKDGVVIKGGILNIETNLLFLESGKYEFDLVELEKLNSNFKKLNSFLVNCITASNTQKFIKFFENSDGYIYGSNIERKSFNGFKGKIDLVTYVSKTNIKEFKGWNQVEDIVLNDFKEIGEIKFDNSSMVGDSIYLSILLKEDYTDKIPEKYKIIKPFTDTINLPLQVVDIDKEAIVEFFKSHDIEEYEIKNLN